jgi:hypothetical protein
MIIFRRQSGNGILPLSIFCCLGLLLFAFAVTIVLTLIPVYLPRRNGGQAQSIQGPLQQVTYSIPPGTIYPTGSLTQAQLAYLVAHVIKVIQESRVHFLSIFSTKQLSITILQHLARRSARQALRSPPRRSE